MRLSWPNMAPEEGGARGENHTMAQDGEGAIRKGEFVSVSYTGRVVDTKEIFDLTDEAAAKEAGLFSESVIYGPMVVAVGEGQMLAGLEEAVVRMAPGERKTVTLTPEHAFGQRDPGKVQTVPEKAFRDRVPKPGIVLNIDGLLGKVQSASAGRVMIDFNHPLAGKTVEYEVTLEKIVTDPKEKFLGILRLHSRKGQNDAVSFPSEGEALVALPEAHPMPPEVMKKVAGEAKRLVPQIRSVKFVYSF